MVCRGEQRPVVLDRTGRCLRGGGSFRRRGFDLDMNVAIFERGISQFGRPRDRLVSIFKAYTEENDKRIETDASDLQGASVRCRAAYS